MSRFSNLKLIQNLNVSCSQNSLLFHTGTDTHGLKTKKRSEIWACLEMHVVCQPAGHNYLFFTSKSCFACYLIAIFFISLLIVTEEKSCICSQGNLQLETYIQEMFVHMMNYQMSYTFVTHGFFLAEGSEILTICTHRSRSETTVRTPKFVITNTV